MRIASFFAIFWIPWHTVFPQTFYVFHLSYFEQEFLKTHLLLAQVTEVRMESFRTSRVNFHRS